MANDWTETPTLVGRHVTLRPLTRDDRAAILEAFATGLAGAFATIVPAPDTIDGWYERLEREHRAGRALPFTVLDQGRRVSGVTRFLRMSEPNRRVEIGGTVYAPRVQRTGLNTEAKLLLLTHAFDTLGAARVVWHTDIHNARSQAAIERLGATKEGSIRKHRIRRDGSWRDSVQYSMTDDDWPKARERLTSRLADG